VGERVFLAGSTGEPTAFVDAWLKEPERTRGRQVFTSFVPGVNPVPVERFHAQATLIGVFPYAGSAKDGSTARGDTLPLSYHGVVRALRQGLQIDTVVVHVSPPDERGFCSFGPAVEFMPQILRKVRRVLAVYNDNIPSFPGSVALDADRIEAFCESSDALRTYASGPSDSLSKSIGARIAAFIDDDTTIQVGLGKIPTALLECLTERRGLRFHSGLITDRIVPLMKAGALASTKHSVSCAMLGGSEFYGWLRGRDDILVRGCEETHDPVRLAKLDRFVAVNSALEVDLLGQANLEQIDGRMISSPGGAPDFAYAASQSPDGLSVVALPALGPKGRSRIVVQLSPGVPVSLPRHCIDVVVTEYGAADLRGLCVEARAERLAEIAEPSSRVNLLAQWHDRGHVRKTQ